MMEHELNSYKAAGMDEVLPKPLVAGPLYMALTAALDGVYANPPDQSVAG